MEKYLISLMLLFSLPAVAEEHMIEISIPAQCLREDLFSEVMANNKELPFVHGQSTRRLDNKVYANPLVMFLDPKLKEWSLVERIGGYYCFISAGIELKPVDTNR